MQNYHGIPVKNGENSRPPNLCNHRRRRARRPQLFLNRARAVLPCILLQPEFRIICTFFRFARHDRALPLASANSNTIFPCLVSGAPLERAVPQLLFPHDSRLPEAAGVVVRAV